MLDADLAELYGVATKALVQAVKRNLSRFPADFMFQLSKEELESWRSQLVTSKPSSRKASGGHPMSSRSKALPCSRVCCGVTGPSTSMSRSCWRSVNSSKHQLRRGAASGFDQTEDTTLVLGDRG